MSTAIISHTGSGDRERNCPMYEGMKEKIKYGIQTVLLSDESLKGYITSDLTLRFLDGYKMRVECEFSCYDEDKQEVEGFSSHCVKGVQSRLEELGYRMESTSSKAGETGTGWLDELGSMIFRQREELEI